MSAWKARLYRWRWWLVAVAVVIAVRVALPEILRRVLISQASKALNAQVEVGDVDLFLLHGDIALEDVSVREATPPLPPSARGGAVAKAYAAEEAPAGGGGEPPTAAAAPARSEAVADETPAEASPSLPAAPPTPQNAEPSPSEPRSSPDAPEATPTPTAKPGATASPAAGTGAPAAPGGGAGEGAEESPPIIAFKRFAVSLHYLPLFSHTVRLREVVLDSPRVDLKRLSSGSFNILALVPAPEKTPAPAGATPATSPTAPAAAAEEGAPWNFGIDRFTLRGGKLRFRDLTLRDSEPVEVSIEQIGFNDVELTPGLYGKPGQAHIEMTVGGGSLTLDAKVSLLKKGVALGCNLKARDLPVREGRLYVPGVGWSGLQGKLDLDLTYDLQTEAKNQLSGTAALREFSVQVPTLTQPALAWRRLGVQIDSLDLLANRLDVASVELDGAALTVRASGGALLPLLATKLQQAAEATPEAKASPDEEAAAPTPGPEGVPEAAPAAGGTGPGPAETAPPAAAVPGTPPAATPQEPSARLSGIAEAQEIPASPPGVPATAAVATTVPTVAAAETQGNVAAETVPATPSPTSASTAPPEQEAAAPGRERPGRRPPRRRGRASSSGPWPR